MNIARRLRLGEVLGLRVLLSSAVVGSLLLSMLGVAIPLHTANANYTEEETAGFIPADVDIYLSVNLDISDDQLEEFWKVANNWWEDPLIQDKWEDLNTLGEDNTTEASISIEDDVLGWIGPELALAQRSSYNLIYNQDDSEQPQATIMFIGTEDDAASNAFFFSKLAKKLAEDEGITAPPDPTGIYSNIDTLYAFPNDETYWAFPSNYIVTASSQEFLEESLDLISGATTDSLAASDNFKAAQASLSTRVGMLYYNIEGFIDHSYDIVQDGLANNDDYVGEYDSDIDLLRDFAKDLIPDYFAVSPLFNSTGISLNAHVAYGDSFRPQSEKITPLQTANLIPDDAIYYYSGMDLKSSWETYKAELGEYWWSDINDSMKQLAGDDKINWPEQVDWTGGYSSIEGFIDYIAGEVGFHPNGDLFSWINDEFGLALLSVSLDEDKKVKGSNMLAVIEVDDVEEVDESLTLIVNGINDLDDIDGNLHMNSTTINSVDATLISNDAATSDAGTPGWLFLDIGSTHYLILGSTEEALTLAVRASNKTITPLSEAVDFKTIIPQLPDDKSNFMYCNLTEIFNSSANNTKETELQQVQDAVDELTAYLGMPIAGLQTPTNDMSAFPDATTAHGTAGVGWSIYSCDLNGDGMDGYGYEYFSDYEAAYLQARYDEYHDAYYDDNYSEWCSNYRDEHITQIVINDYADSVNVDYYVYAETTTWKYTCDNEGNVTQHGAATDTATGIAIDLMPVDSSLGLCSIAGTSPETMVGTMYLLPPSIIQYSIPGGIDGATIEIPEQTIDFTQLDPNVGEVSVQLDVVIKGNPENTSIQAAVMKDVTDEIQALFTLAATDADLSIQDVAFVVKVEKTNLTSENVGKVVLKLKVGKAWTDIYGTDHVRMFRIGDDGTKEMLPTKFKGYDDDQAIFEGTSKNGLSYFGLLAVEGGGLNSGSSWGVIIGIVIGVLLLGGAVVILLSRRNRTSGDKA